MKNWLTFLLVLGGITVPSLARAQESMSLPELGKESTPKTVVGTITFPYPAWSQVPTAVYQPAKESAPTPVLPVALAEPNTTTTTTTTKQEIVANSPILCEPVVSEVCKAMSGDDCKSDFFVFGDILAWRVHGADIPFAQPFDGVGPLAVPKGPVADVNPGTEAGVRLGFGIPVNDHSWVVTTFTYFRDYADAYSTAPDGSVLHSNVVFPNTVNGAFVPLAANATNDIRLYMGDIDYKCAFVNTESLQVSWLAGIRYAHLQQNFTTNYAIFGTTTVNTGINFDGIGPRAGLEGEYKIGCGFYGYGKGMINLLAGRFAANYLQTQTFVGQQAQTSVYDDRLVPVLEAELGIGWTSSNGRLSISAGYYVGSWTNALTTNSLVQGVQNNNYTTNGNNFRDTLTFDGLFGRIEFRF
jgi:hypothetical protein